MKCLKINQKMFYWVSGIKHTENLLENLKSKRIKINQQKMGNNRTNALAYNNILTGKRDSTLENKDAISK